MFYVYLLYSIKDHSFYIGQTRDINSRLHHHNSGRVVSTRSKRPWKLLKFEEYKTRDEARWREHSLKKSANLRKKFYGD